MRVRYWTSADVIDKTLGDLIEYDVSSAYSERGAVEDAHSKIECLTKFVGLIAEQLTLAQQHIVADSLFHHRLVEEEKEVAK